MAEAANLTIVIDAQNKASAAFKQVQESTEKTHTSFVNFTKAVVFGNAIFSLTSDVAIRLKKGFDDVVKTADALQASEAQINHLLEQTHYASGQTAESIGKMADQISRTTPISREATLSAAQMLIPFTNIHKETFPGVMKAADDLATHLNHGLAPNADQVAQAAKQLGRAFNDPANGMGLLRRAGVALTHDQQEQIKTLQKHGDLLGAQRLLLDDLAKTMGGSATAAAQTFRGRMTMLHNEMVDRGAQAYTRIREGLVNFGNAAIRFTQTEVFKAWLSAVHTEINIVGAVFTAAWNLIKKAVDALMPSIKVLWDALEKNVVPTVKTFTEAVQRLWNALNPALMDTLKVIGVIIGVTLYAAIWLAINALRIAIEVFRVVISIISDVIGWISNLIGWFGRLGSGILHAIGGFGSLLYNAGKDLIQGLMNGVSDMWHHAVDHVKNLGHDIANGLKSVLHIFSPSGVFHEIGQNIGLGMVNGITSMHAAVRSAAGGLADSSLIGVGGGGLTALSGGAGGGVSNDNSKVINITQNNTFTRDTDALANARKLAFELSRR